MEDIMAAVEQRETTSLIGSDKVEGTAVYGSDDKRIGSIDRVMIDKQSGKVAYAVLSYGGFLGIGDDHYPTPWSSLKYDNPSPGLCRRRYHRSIARCPKVQQRQRLGLVAGGRRARIRLLQSRALLVAKGDGAPDFIKFGLRSHLLSNIIATDRGVGTAIARRPLPA
jgi:hypothetical protein